MARNAYAGSNRRRLSEYTHGGQHEYNHYSGQHSDEQDHHDAQETVQKTGPYGDLIFHNHIVFPNKVLKKEAPVAETPG